MNMGFDSLMSIELKNQIETDLGVSIAMARLIQGPTLLELADWVLQLLVTTQSIEVNAPLRARRSPNLRRESCERDMWKC